MKKPERKLKDGYLTTPLEANGDLKPTGLSRARDILPLLPFSRTTLHQWSEDGRFPKSVKLTPTVVAWRNEEVLEWLENAGSITSEATD